MDENLHLDKLRKEREAAKKAAEIAQDQEELAFTNATELKYTMRGSTQGQMMSGAVERKLDQKVKLYYFPFEARSGSIRMMLDYAGADWEDMRIKMEDWPAIKPTMPGGGMPCLEF